MHWGVCVCACHMHACTQMMLIHNIHTVQQRVRWGCDGCSVTLCCRRETQRGDQLLWWLGEVNAASGCMCLMGYISHFYSSGALWWLDFLTQTSNLPSWMRRSSILTPPWWVLASYPGPSNHPSFAIGLFIHTCHSESNAPPSLPSTAQTPRRQAAGSGPLWESLYEGSEPVHRPIHPPFKGLCLHCACGPEIREGQCEGKTARVDRSTTPDLFGVWSGICGSEEGTTWCATY